MGERMQQALQKIEAMRQENLEGGGPKLIERQHSLGKLTARERIDLLADPGTFHEFGSMVRTPDKFMDGRERRTPCEGAVIGTARVNGRSVGIYASDFTVLGGSVNNTHMAKFCKLMELCERWGIPFIWLLDSTGARLNQMRKATDTFNFWMVYQSMMLGSVPQLQLLCGPCIAGAGYCPCLVDFLVMTRGTGYLWLGGPRMVKAATAEDMLSKEADQGTGDYHMRYNGTCDMVAKDDADGIEHLKKFLSYVPSNNKEEPPFVDTGDNPARRVDRLIDIVPEELDKPYDTHEVIEEIVDKGTFYELKPGFGKQIVTGFCRFAGHAAGIVANNPVEPGSSVEPDASDKYYRFLEFLDSYNIPLVTLVDTPPLVSGDELEREGILRHHGKLIYMYSIATIPKITIVLRRAYFDSGAYAMGCTHGMGADLVYAWPIAEFAIEAAKPDLMQVFQNEIPQSASGYLARARDKLDAFTVANQYAVEVLDNVIEPADTRIKIIEALKVTEKKVKFGSEKIPRKRSFHGSPPT